MPEQVGPVWQGSSGAEKSKKMESAAPDRRLAEGIRAVAPDDGANVSLSLTDVMFPPLNENWWA
jgi:hypothetical protein